MLIVIEGVDGAGKGTQTELLVHRLRREGYTANSMSFPRYGKTIGAKLVRQYLNGDFGQDLSPETAAMFYAIDRSESRPLLESLMESNDIMILDRYVWSNMAHQSARFGTGDGAAYQLTQWIDRIEFNVFGMPRPDMTFLIDVNHVMAGRNITERAISEVRGTDIHEMDKTHMISARQQYLKLANAYRWNVVNAMQNTHAMRTAESICEEIAGKILQSIGHEKTTSEE